ncbi:MAG: PKD domain-containing protein [candidate division Zixibacteria bacterium]|nr:PKD domain-containing protein [candidate division Zixibacteria bacterium]
MYLSVKKSIISRIIFSLLTLTLLFFYPSISLAEQATIAEMDNVCQNWLLLNASIDQNFRGIDNSKIISIDNIEDGDLMLGRIYNLSPDGFVVVPILKEMPPIMTYSDRSALNENPDQGMRALISDVLYSRMISFIEVYGDLDAVLATRGEGLPGQKQRDLWDRYSVDQEKFVSLLKNGALVERWESVGPLLTTAWHQGSPYNMYCPLGYGDQQTVVGCVATAAAQILYYWQWPVQGIGEYTYYWGGDNSCDTSTSPEILSADLSDPYIYDNTPENMAELSYEIGVAFRMDYGVCGSASFTYDGISVYSQYFKYQPNIQRRDRRNYTNGTDWYNDIKEEIGAGRPLHYRIKIHSIVCDGYRETGGINYYHMNYGWGGNANAWFAIDDLYCSWEGCGIIEEYYIYNIEPRWVWPSSDVTFGFAPLDVNISGETDYEVDNWIWDFGDDHTIIGDYPTVQHTYESPGIYDLTVEIESDGESYSAIRPEYMIVLADTISAGTVFGEVGEVIEIPIFTNNTIPLNKIVIPVAYSGGIKLRYDSCSTLGCRTEGFLQSGGSIGSGFLKFELMSNGNSLEPGNGLLLKTYFTITSGADDLSTTIYTKNIGTTYPLFKNNTNGLEYNPIPKSGAVYFQGTYGDTNSDDNIDILDIVQIINYVYKDGPDAIPPHVANVNGDQSIDILDIVYLINFIYKGGPAPMVL